MAFSIVFTLAWVSTMASPTVGAAPHLLAAGGSPQTLAVTLTGTNGVGRIVTPGRSCADGGTGNYRHYTVEAALPGGSFSRLPGQARATFDVHHDGVEPPVGPITVGAFLLGTESHTTFTNQRGALELRLAGGGCGGPTSPLAMSGSDITFGPATGMWALDPASTNGSYRGATGSGTFSLTASVAAGADNPWSLGITGTISVLQPIEQMTAAKTFWGNLGADYVTRKVSVVYQITNSGPGDAFDVVLATATSPTAGIAPLGPAPQPLGDLRAGQSATATVRYQLGLVQPCGLVILGCQFDTTVTVTAGDALDVPTTQTASAHVVAPNFPPPL